MNRIHTSVAMASAPSVDPSSLHPAPAATAYCLRSSSTGTSWSARSWAISVCTAEASCPASRSCAAMVASSSCSLSQSKSLSRPCCAWNDVAVEIIAKASEYCKNNKSKTRKIKINEHANQGLNQGSNQGSNQRIERINENINNETQK